jgi:hypothetical protein
LQHDETRIRVGRKVNANGPQRTARGTQNSRVQRRMKARPNSQDYPLKTVLAIVTLSTLLSACAGFVPAAAPANVNTADLSSAATVSVVSDDDAAVDTSVNEGLPLLALSDELMFKFLTAEIAFQRGNWQSGYINMLAAAQETRDPRLARRAAEMAITAKQSGEALAAIRLWRALAPKSEEATQYYLGLILLGDDLSEVQEVFEQRLRDVRPQSRGMLLLQIQRLLLRAKDKTAAFSLLERVTAPYQNLFEAHVALAQAAFVNDDAVRARRSDNRTQGQARFGNRRTDASSGHR